MNRPSAPVVAPSGNADQLRLSRFSDAEAVLIESAERVDAGNLDLRPRDRFAPGLDEPAADDAFRPELERDRCRWFCGVS